MPPSFQSPVFVLTPAEFKSRLGDFRSEGGLFVKGIHDRAKRLFAWQYLEYLSDFAQGLNHRPERTPR